VLGVLFSKGVRDIPTITELLEITYWRASGNRRNNVYIPSNNSENANTGLNLRKQLLGVAQEVTVAASWSDIWEELITEQHCSQSSADCFLKAKLAGMLSSESY
jgi:hypothetical protein